MALTSYSSKDTRWHRFAPLWVSMLLVIVSVVPFFSPTLVAFCRGCIWVTFYIFMVYRVQHVSPWMFVVVGIFQDLLYGVPIGVHVFPFFVIYFYVLWQYAFLSEYGFVGLLGHFAIIFSIATLVIWVLIDFLTGQALSFGVVAMNYMMTLISYVIWVPLLSKIFDLSSRD